MTDHADFNASPEERSCPRWYVVQCKGGESFRASEHLSNQGYRVFHPVLEMQKKRRGKLCWAAEPLFPYYLFIHLNRLSSNWRPIRSTRGVLRLVSFGDEPLAVPDALIDSLQECAQRRAEDQQANVYFRPGEIVEITAGPFQELQAVFESQKGEERAVILISMLHKQQRLEMPIGQLRRSS
ncbi:transcription/translation regulatory transformer protein RfaH [Halomonas shantousis]